MNSLNSAIDAAWITFPCPTCGLENDCRIQQVTLGERVHCRGCHESIQLVDKDASTVIAKRQIESELCRLQNAFKKFR